MGNLWQSAFANFRLFTGADAEPDEATSRQIDHAIDRLIDETDPRLRVVYNYHRRLRPAMKAALNYIEGLVDKIPGPLEVCAKAYSEDPRVKAFFANVNDLHRVYSNSRLVNEFFSSPENLDTPECHALLCMHKNEKRRFGVGLIGDKVRHDVPQTLVSFGDHQILSPARDERSARRVLQDCLLCGLFKQARDPLIEERELRKTAEDRQRRVRSHLKALQREQAAKQGDARLNDEIAAAERELQEIEQQLDCLQGEIGSLDDHLDRLVEGLERAPEHIQVETCVLHLSNTHVLLDKHPGQDGIEVPLAEVKLGKEPPRVVSLTRYPRDEFLPATKLW